MVEYQGIRIAHDAVVVALVALTRAGDRRILEKAIDPDDARARPSS
jgi:hypothetical protein